MLRRPYAEFLRYATRVSKRAHEAEDLLQSVLLAAIEVGRVDIACPNTRRWIRGALRKRALFEARSVGRRRRRESLVFAAKNSRFEVVSVPADLLSTWPPSLRTTLLLALTGHSKAEIACLLRLSDAALRQRIAGIRKRMLRPDGRAFSEMYARASGQNFGLNGSLRFGQIRRALLKTVHQNRALLASHDPDGNLFVLCSQNRGSRQYDSTSTSKKD